MQSILYSYFVIVRCFVIFHSLICNCPLLIYNQFQCKVFVGLVWLTSNRMFGLGDFWDKLPSWFLKNLILPSFNLDNFKIFKNVVGQFLPNLPHKHVITSASFHFSSFYLLKISSNLNNTCDLTKTPLNTYADLLYENTC